MKVLNLYAGIGGNRKLWEDVDVTAVEYRKDISDVYKHYFPGDIVIVGDAHDYLLNHYHEFDFIWTSPPCPTHSRARYWGYKNTKPVYPDMKLYQEIIFLKNHFNGKWVVENTIPYYEVLIPAQEIDRHLFWTNFNIGKINNKTGDIHKDGNSGFEKLYGYELSGFWVDKSATNYSDGRERLTWLRNCVSPEIGLHILNMARGIIKSQDVLQKTIFD